MKVGKKDSKKRIAYPSYSNLKWTYFLTLISFFSIMKRSSPIVSMAQSCHFKKWGRDISFTSGEAASEGNKNSLWVMKGTIVFLHERLSRNSEEIFFSLWLLSLEWRNIIVPWMTNREFFPSPFFCLAQQQSSIWVNKMW